MNGVLGGGSTSVDVTADHNLINPVSGVLESSVLSATLQFEAPISCYHSIFGVGLEGLQNDLGNSSGNGSNWDDGTSNHNITINDLVNEPKLGYRVHYEKNTDSKPFDLKAEEYFDKSLSRSRLKCPNCYFLTDHHGNLTQHMKVHEKPEWNILYQCEFCSFQTRYKNSIKGHLVRHEETANTQPKKRRGKGKKWKRNY